MANLRALNVTPHVTQNNGITKTGKSRRSAIDERTTRPQRYGMPQSRRPMIECIFGWGKQHGTMRKTKHRVICRVAADFMLNLIAYNLIPVPKLVAARPAKLPRAIDRITRATPTREKPMLFPASFNFKAAVTDVAKLVDRPWCAPSGIDRRCSLRRRTGFFQQTARQTDGLPTRHKRDRACACDRAQGSGLHSCH